MWDQFADLGGLEAHVLDTSQHDPATSLQLLGDGVDRQRFLLRPSA
jgi:hypothetical protein